MCSHFLVPTAWKACGCLNKKKEIAENNTHQGEHVPHKVGRNTKREKQMEKKQKNLSLSLWQRKNNTWLICSNRLRRRTWFVLSLFCSHQKKSNCFAVFAVSTVEAVETGIAMGLPPDGNALTSTVWESLKSSFLGGKAQGKNLRAHSSSSDIKVELPCYTGLLFPGLSMLSCACGALVHEVHLCNGECTKVLYHQVRVKWFVLSLASNAIPVYIDGKFSPHFAYCICSIQEWTNFYSGYQ